MKKKHLAFIESLAKSSIGKDLIEYLRDVETEFADVRNLGQVDPKIRIDALKMFRECLLDKLLVLSGEVAPPDGDEYH